MISELRLSEKITKELIFLLGKDGDVQYFAHFARPFFEIRIPGYYDVKGIEGNKTTWVHLKNPGRYSLEAFIENLENMI